MRLPRRRYAPLYDGFDDHASRFNCDQRGALCGRRCVVCIRSWRDKQSSFEKDEFVVASIDGSLILWYNMRRSKF